MKNKKSLFVVMVLTAVMAVSGYVLASEPQEQEKGQAMVEDQIPMTEEDVKMTEEAMQDDTQMIEETMQEETADKAMMEEAQEEAMEKTQEADK